MSYRPPNWPPCPCDGCPKKEEDCYGLVCDLVCGKNSAWVNHEAGADALWEAVKAQRLVEITEKTKTITLPKETAAFWKSEDFDTLFEWINKVGISGCGWLVWIPDEEMKDDNV